MMIVGECDGEDECDDKDDSGSVTVVMIVGGCGGEDDSGRV